MKPNLGKCTSAMAESPKDKPKEYIHLVLNMRKIERHNQRSGFESLRFNNRFLFIDASIHPTDGISMQNIAHSNATLRSQTTVSAFECIGVLIRNSISV